MCGFRLPNSAEHFNPEMLDTTQEKGYNVIEKITEMNVNGVVPTIMWNRYSASN